MLTGRPPYWREVQETQREFGQLILDHHLQPVPPTWVNPELISGVDELAARILAFRPEVRPQSAKQFLEELSTFGRLSGDIRIPFAELRNAHIPIALGATTTHRES
jgi:hypothetical protein